MTWNAAKSTDLRLFRRRRRPLYIYIEAEQQLRNPWCVCTTVADRSAKWAAATTNVLSSQIVTWLQPWQIPQIKKEILTHGKLKICVCLRKNMYAGGDAQMNGDMPHDGGHGGGGHAVGEELQKTGRYEALAALNTPGWTCHILPKDKRFKKKKITWFLSGAHAVFCLIKCPPCLCLQVLWGSVTWHQKKSAFLHQWLHRRVPHSGLVNHLVYLPGHRDKRHHFRRPVGRCYRKHAGRDWALPSAAFPVRGSDPSHKCLHSCVQGVLESFLGTAITGGVFCLLAGQPLTILSSTGPVLVFERLLFNFSKCVLRVVSALQNVTDYNPQATVHVASVNLLCFCVQGQRVWLFGVPSVDRPVVGVLLPGPGGHRCQLLGAVLHPLHRGGLLLSHKLHLHLWRLQEDAEAGSPLPHRLWLQDGSRHAVRMPLHGSDRCRCVFTWDPQKGRHDWL